MKVRMWPGSLRARLLAVICVMGIVVLVLVGLWIERSASRSGEAALRSHLGRTVNEAAVDIGRRWTALRSDLLDLADTPALRDSLRRVGERPDPDVPPTDSGLVRVVRNRSAEVVVAPWLASGSDLLPPVRSVDVYDLHQRARWRLEAATADAGRPVRTSTAASIPLEVPVYASPLGPEVGSLRAEIPVRALLPDPTPAPGGVAAVLGVFDTETDAPLVPLPFAYTGTLDGPVILGDRWLLVRRELTTPGLTVVGAAPLSPFAGPIRDATRRGTWLLLGVLLAGFGAAALLTSHMAHSLNRLAEAAEAVAAGDLTRRVEEGSSEEVSRVARAFNRMTASLRDTLRSLSDHRALAAVGEFAASLAHEIRNPLTAIGVDLKVVEEELPADSSGRRPLERARREIRRLDRTLEGTLQAARSGRSTEAEVGVGRPLRRAVEAARTAADSREVGLTVVGTGTSVVSGDPDSLEQLFLNLILNAVEAAPTGSEVRIETKHEGDRAVVVVLDRGPGLSPEMVENAFEPLVSGRKGGTGLGLTVCRRIARALGGSVRLDNREDGGAAATVELPLGTTDP